MRQPISKLKSFLPEVEGGKQCFISHQEVQKKNMGTCGRSGDIKMFSANKIHHSLSCLQITCNIW